jgi:UDP-glucose 4-epimerase
MADRILVTGAYGFVGRHVARAAAARGHFVTGIGHGAWSRDEWTRWGLKEWYAETIDIDSLVTHANAPDVIIHCAGSSSVAFSMANPVQDHQRTVGSTLAVLEYIRLHRPAARLVIPSSAGVYGAAARQPIGVDSPLLPVSPYGLHKRIAEDLCRSYGRHFGVACAAVRLFSVFGVGLRKQLWWDACSKLAAGNAHFGGTGDETRDWLHVDDAARLLLTAGAHADAACPIVNGGSGAAVTVRAVVQAFAQAFGPDGGEPRFDGVSRSGDPAHYRADIAEAAAWGWAPQRYWTDEIGPYVDWFRAGAL